MICRNFLLYLREYKTNICQTYTSKIGELCMNLSYYKQVSCNTKKCIEEIE